MLNYVTHILPFNVEREPKTIKTDFQPKIKRRFSLIQWMRTITSSEFGSLKTSLSHAKGSSMVIFSIPYVFLPPSEPGQLHSFQSVQSSWECGKKPSSELRCWKFEKQTVALIFLRSKQVSCILREAWSSALTLKLFKSKQFSYITTETEEFHSDTKNPQAWQCQNLAVEKKGPQVTLLFQSLTITQ